jgi:hypothetical protein
MFTDVYIGRLSDGPDPLDWGGEFRIGNAPGRISPFFPPTGSFWSLKKKIEKGDLPGKQVDWGAWAANVSKTDILDFIAQHYGGRPVDTDVAELIAFVEALPDVRDALVASEL